MVYAEPVHYRQGDAWGEIDNTLTDAVLLGDATSGQVQRLDALSATQKQSLAQSARADGRLRFSDYLENTDNAFTVQFPQRLTEQKPVMLQWNGHTLRFSPLGLNNSTARVTQSIRAGVMEQELQERLATTTDTNQQKELQEEQFTSVTKNRSAVTYPAVSSMVDLKYYVIGQSLKEDLVLQALPAQTAFSFDFTTDLQAVKNEDNTVSFLNEDNETVFIIASPCMYDMCEGYSRDITITLQTISGGYRYTIVPNRDWLEADERVFPVTIDPSVYTTQNSSYIHDNGVQQSNPTTNYITSDRMYLGSGPNSTEGRIYFKLTQWPSASALSAEYITSARLNMSYYPQVSWQTGQGITGDVYTVNSAWDTNTITWNSQINIGGTYISSLYLSSSFGKTSGYDSYDVTAWAKKHYSSPSTDYGIRLQPHSLVNSVNRVCYISSDYSANSALRPIMKIDYIGRVFNLVGITDSGHDHTSFFNNSVPSGYTKSTYTDISSAETIVKMQTSRVFISRSHGSQHSITCTGGSLTSTHISALPDNSLSHVKLVYYGACSTGSGGITADNLVNTTYSKGAQIVIGFKNSVSCTACNAWTQAFMEQLGAGRTVSASVKAADDAVNQNPGGTENHLIRGDADRSIT